MGKEDPSTRNTKTGIRESKDGENMDNVANLSDDEFGRMMVRMTKEESDQRKEIDATMRILDQILDNRI